MQDIQGQGQLFGVIKLGSTIIWVTSRGLNYHRHSGIILYNIGGRRCQELGRGTLLNRACTLLILITSILLCLPHMRMRSKSQFVVYCLLSSAQKSPDLEMYTSEQLVSTMELSKSSKNLYERRKRCVLLATPINHTLMCFCSCAQCTISM